MHALGLSNAAFAAYFTGLGVLITVAYVAVALLIIRWRSHETTALVTACLLVVLPLLFNTNRAPGLPFVWRMLGEIGLVAAFPLLVMFLCIFPKGKFLPAWSAYGAGAFAVIWLLQGPFPGTPLDISSWPGTPQGSIVGAAIQDRSSLPNGEFGVWTCASQNNWRTWRDLNPRPPVPKMGIAWAAVAAGSPAPTPASASENAQCIVAVVAPHELACLVAKHIVDAQYHLVGRENHIRVPS